MFQPKTLTQAYTLSKLQEATLISSGLSLKMNRNTTTVRTFNLILEPTPIPIPLTHSNLKPTLPTPQTLQTLIPQKPTLHLPTKHLLYQTPSLKPISHRTSGMLGS